MPNTAFAESLHLRSGGAIPSESATPEEVRMYITELLIDDYYTPPDEAKRHASKWEMGRTSQLFLNNQETQRRIFGENVGLCIHSALQKRMKAIWDRQPSVAYSSYALIGSITLLISYYIFLAFTLDLTKISDIRILGKSSALWLLIAICGAFWETRHPYDPNKGGAVVFLSVVSCLFMIMLLTALFAAS